MAQVKITLTDKENGQVHIDVDPAWEVIYKLAKENKVTPAQAYAFSGIVKIMKDSKAIARMMETESPVFNPETPRLDITN